MTTHGRKDRERERDMSKILGSFLQILVLKKPKIPPCPSCLVTSLREYRCLYIAYRCSNSVAASNRVFWYVAPY